MATLGESIETTTTKTNEGAAENDFIFQSGGVRLLVTCSGKELTGSVSSHAMAFASPVWRKFVYQPWQPDLAVEQLDFREDNGEALLVLLSIAHLHFKKVPKKLAYEVFLQIAILCDKFDCEKLVRPWLDTWFDDGMSKPKRTLMIGNSEQVNWIFIAWVFGNEKLFREGTSILVQHTTETRDGELVNAAKFEIGDHLPPGLLESVRAIRHTQIEQLLEIPYKKLHRISESKTPLCSHKDLACDNLAYGCIVRALDEMHAWPETHSKAFNRSVAELVDGLKFLQVLALPTRGGKKDKVGNHTDCMVNLPFHNAIIAWEQNPSSAVLPSHLEYLKLQKEKIND